MDAETVNLVLAALAAAGVGASAGLEDAAKTAVTDAYQALVGRLKKVWPGRQRSDDGLTTTPELDAEELIARYRDNPGEWSSAIRDVLLTIDDSDAALKRLAADVNTSERRSENGDSVVIVNSFGVQNAQRARKPEQINYFGSTATAAGSADGEDR